MGKVRMRYVVERPAKKSPTGVAYFFQPTPSLKRAGLAPEPLGYSLANAEIRQRELVGWWDAYRKGEDLKPAQFPEGSFGAFFQWLQNTTEQEEKSDRTQEEYGRITRQMILPIFGPALLIQVEPRHCKAFHKRMKDQGETLDKIWRTFKWLRFTFNEAIREGRLTNNPAKAVKIKRPSPRTQTLEEWELRKAIALAWRTGRDALAAMLTVLYDTSLRPSDVRALTGENDFGDHLAGIQDKTDREYNCPLWPTTRRAIDRYKRRRGYIVDKGQPIFRTVKGRPWARLRLSREMRALFRDAGISDDKQVRDIRRTVSQQQTAAGATVGELAASRGHSYETAAAMLETYSPRTLEMAEAAQEKRLEYLKAKRREQRENKE